MGLFDVFRRKSPSKNEIILNSETNFYINHHDYVTQLDASLTSYLQRFKNISNIDEEIDLLKQLIDWYNTKKKEAETLGGEFQRYFYDMYEHCHNSREKDFSIITQHKERLQFLEENYESEKEREAKLKTLHDDVIALLKENDGILQRDFCKLFDSNIRNEVRKELYFADKNGLISREKTGNTYFLYVISK